MWNSNKTKHSASLFILFHSCQHVYFTLLGIAFKSAGNSSSDAVYWVCLSIEDCIDNVKFDIKGEHFNWRLKSVTLTSMRFKTFLATFLLRYNYYKSEELCQL